MRQASGSTNVGDQLRYLRVEWKHDYPSDPILIYSELDDDGWEVRKVELFRDGQMGYASQQAETEFTALGDVPVASLESLAENLHFAPTLISQDEFEYIWQQARGAR